jgi:signal peptidase II
MPKDASSGQVLKRHAIYAAAVFIGVIALDQISKVVVRETIDLGDAIRLFPGLHLVNVRNSGVAFGLFADGGAAILIVTIVAIVALIWLLLKNLSRPLVWLPTGLLLGGAVGNAIDRIRADSVTDFIKFPNWPAFNVADTAITLGAIALVVVLFLLSRKEAPAETESPVEREPSSTEESKMQ